jgi:hypothetical protein
MIADGGAQIPAILGQPTDLCAAMSQIAPLISTVAGK